MTNIVLCIYKAKIKQNRDFNQALFELQNSGILTTILNVKQKWSDVWTIRVMEVLHSVSYEKFLTKVKQKVS